MPHDTDLRSTFEEYCTTATVFERVLSTLLVAAHRNGVEVAGAWEAHENGSDPEWDVVVSVLARRGDGSALPEDGDHS
jgi:hypothetical protein